jgi:hypothetical protein
MAAAGGDEKVWLGEGDCGPDSPPPLGTNTVGVEPGLIPVPAPVDVAVAGVEPTLVLVVGKVGARSGVAGALGEGEADSTTHMRWLWVATSFATV